MSRFRGSHRPRGEDLEGPPSLKHCSRAARFGSGHPKHIPAEASCNRHFSCNPAKNDDLYRPLHPTSAVKAAQATVPE